MPTFSPETFPHVFECMDCPRGSSAKVTYDQAATLAPEGATEREAVNHVLTVEHGWHVGKRRKMCGKCLADLD